MKRLAILLAMTALAACSSEPAPEPSPTPSETATVSSTVGTYEVTAVDGTKFTAAVNADGTYTDTAADGTVMESGTWADTDGKTCFTPTEGEVQCYALGEPAEDGSVIATPDKGDAVTIKKVG
jgi:streptogramin lyase